MLWDPSKDQDTNLFLSAESLGLFPKQRDGLIKTLAYMEAGLIKEDIPNNDRLQFTMTTWVTRAHCGTACCIGGTATILSEDQGLFDRYPSSYGTPNCYAPGDLENLFFHWGGGDVTVPRAAQQLRHYLTTGDCERDWAIESNRVRRGSSVG